MISMLVTKDVLDSSAAVKENELRRDGKSHGNDDGKYFN